MPNKHLKWHKLCIKMHWWMLMKYGDQKLDFTFLKFMQVPQIVLESTKEHLASLTLNRPTSPKRKNGSKIIFYSWWLMLKHTMKFTIQISKKDTCSCVLGILHTNNLILPL